MVLETHPLPPPPPPNAFVCPHCGVLSQHRWYVLLVEEPGFYVAADGQKHKCNEPRFVPAEGLKATYCTNCMRMAVWQYGKRIFPLGSSAPLADGDMPEEVRNDYDEARSIADASPRAGAALLRLALQKLMRHLGENGKSLNDDIGALVKKSLIEDKVQKALDSVRCYGGEAVHPGQIDLKDDRETVSALFDLVNLIVRHLITEPKKVDELYSRLPETARKQIEKRDSDQQAK